MTTNAKIAIGLAVGFGLAALVWYFTRTTTAGTPGALPGSGGNTSIGDAIRGIGGSVLGVAGGIADAASATGGQGEGAVIA